MDYGGIEKEETLKGLIYEDYFSKFGYEPNIDNIDFVITDKKSRGDLFSEGPGSSRHLLWAEAKKGTHDIFSMFTQLILTCKKTYEKGDHFAPPWLGCFDEARISFVPFHDILPVFNETDFNWNTTPSNHEAADFIKAKEKIKNLIGAKLRIFHFGSDSSDIREFIKAHFIQEAGPSIHIPITKDNFVQIFIKWVKEVKPFINITKETWSEFKDKGILDCDFFRADLMSEGGNTITEKLKIILKNDNYKFQETISGMLFSADIGFTDTGAAYSRFWNRYKRPPAKEFQQHIIDRRDLLVPQNIREVKGSFFTPKIWADKSKEYLEQVFGKNWQNEYYIWDCAAGTGNLLAGLTNPYNAWASDLEQGNVETIQSLIDIDENLNLLSGHVFQFDFLNDKFDKLPKGLREIINDPEKRKKLIVYINPPYAEHGSRTTMTGSGENKTKVATEHYVYGLFSSLTGAATRELFVQFFLRIYKDIPNSKLAAFSKLKYVTAENFIKFREYFKATYKAGFICEANTFDNVKGKFPIGFIIWDLDSTEFITFAKTDIYFNDNALSSCWSKGTKIFYPMPKNGLLVNWLRKFYDNKSKPIGYLRVNGPDFANNQGVFFTSFPSSNDIEQHFIINISEKNISEMCIYLAVRHSIAASWINDRDQFLFPNNLYNDDMDFTNDCLIFVLFHGQNRIQNTKKGCSFIPFTEKEVNAKEKFRSNFMSDFLENKTLAPEAQAVLDEGRKLWVYYHDKIKTNKAAPVDASFYDIREFFQGRKKNGTMNTKSTDEQYNALIKNIREALKSLAAKIEPKIYEYGFLKK